MAKFLVCPWCGELHSSMRALYWHCRYEHDLPHNEAYEGVSDANIADNENGRPMVGFDGDRYYGNTAEHIPPKAIPDPDVGEGFWHDGDKYSRESYQRRRRS